MKSLWERALVALCCGLGLAGPASAQSNYPDRDVVIIVPYSAGGTTDVAARLIAYQLSKELGRTFVIDNKPGAGGTLGVTLGANAKPDGYTLVVSPVGTHGIAPSLYGSLQYDAQNDFEPVVMLQTQPNIVVVNNDFPAKSIDELITYAKEHPDELNVASAGIGTSIHLASEMFETEAGVDFLHIPYPGSAQAVTSLMSGETQVMFDNMPSAFPHVKSGNLRALAVTSATRSPAAPDIPTVAEAATVVDLKAYDATGWTALFAPKGTPAEVVDVLNAAVNRALKKPEVVEAIIASGSSPGGGTPQELGTFVSQEIVKWKDVIEKAGVEKQ
ncbi:Bug family tripartite tricarboxylate transporter substrate binding protein [Aureimonas ureilytica]|uniref:Bug family tripartite tricarboxylate transporter substrate binding protein n=1 Tax=Aureimonas ureilytica TaxID=401562 RepID=UPI00039BD067|nr:tripartite tricarboxylate transporter substrate binding protein [Aureimonas ureilytica]